MAEVLLFHHALGLTDGVRAFAEDLREAGHVVHTPDLYEGRTFSDLAGGVAHAEDVGFGTLLERGRVAADGLPDEVVYAGFSLGVLPAQMLAQTRPGARGAVLVHSCVPVPEFGDAWPAGVPAQIHLTEGDEWVLPPNEDLEAARALAGSVDDAKLFLYPGSRHLFADPSGPDFDESSTTLLRRRLLAFLDRLG